MMRIRLLCACLVGPMAYFQFISMLMDVDRYPMPNGVKPELKPIRIRRHLIG